MNTVQRIAKNTAVLLIANIVSKILGFFYIMYAARYLGAAGFGVLAFALAFAGIFGVLADIGLQPLTIREVARNKLLTHKYLKNVAFIKILLSIGTFGLMTLTITLLGYPEQTVKVVCFIGLSVILVSFSEMINSIFQAFERMEFVSVGQILKNLLLLCGILFAVKMGFSVVGIASIYLITSIIVVIYSYVILNWKTLGTSYKWIPWDIEIDWGFWKSIIKKALPFGLSAIFVMVYFWIDSVMLSLMKGDEVVGWYNASYRLVFVLMFIPGSLVNAIFPVVSKYYRTSQESLVSVYRRAFKYLFILGLPIGVGTTFLADRIIPIIYGASYGPSIGALQILIWAGVLLFITPLFGTVLASIDRQDLGMWAVGICAIANIVINLLLIPKFSYTGASIATVITEGIGFVLQFYFVSKYLYRIRLSQKSIMPILASLVMLLAIFLLRELNLAIIMAIAIVVYFGIICSSKTISEEDIILFKKIFKAS
ncbi:MAG: flippase [Deltaproteobacteria bacterium]|nr:flippase [Deltaproteobacteria bacterium]